MKVLWFSNTPANASIILQENNVGGGWLQSLDKELQNKVDLHVCFYYPRLNKSFKYLNTHYHPISPKNWKVNTIKNIFTNVVSDNEDLECFLNVIERVKPDLIHIHGTESSFSCIIRKTHIPVVVSIQGNLNYYYHKFLSAFSYKELKFNPVPKSNRINSFFFNKSFYNLWLQFKKMKTREIKYLQGAQHIIGRTDWDRRTTRILAPKSKYYHSDELLRDIFYNGAEWEKHNRDKIIIHTTTSDSPYKGFETICEALFELNKISHINFEWRIAGLNDQSKIVKITQKKLKSRYPSKGLVLMGKLQENKLHECMMDADIFVTASHADNSPNSLCEAMMLGIPSIATFAGGTPSLLCNNEEGILLQDGDPWALAGAIIELINEPGKSVLLGEKARQRAIKRHDKKKIVSDLLNIYEKIIQSK